MQTQQRKPRPRTFGTNLHLRRPKVAEIYSEITGRKVGRVVHHGDGRVDAHIKPEPVRWGPEDIERFLPLNDLRRLIYDYARRPAGEGGLGMSHEEAVGRMFRDGRIIA